MSPSNQKSSVKVALLALVAAGSVSIATAAGSGSAVRAAMQESRAYLHSYNIPSSGVALEGYCPVAYFAVDKSVRGRSEYASTHNDVTYYFV